jgi:hypothetical protein
MYILCHFIFTCGYVKGGAVAQTVSPWLPTAAARVRARSGLVGFVVEKVALEQIF